MQVSCREISTPCIDTRTVAADFARKLIQDLPTAVAARRLSCSERVVAGLRNGDYEPAEPLINRWRLKFGKHFESALSGDNPAICAKRARVAVLLREIREMEEQG